MFKRALQSSNASPNQAQRINENKLLISQAENQIKQVKAVISLMKSVLSRGKKEVGWRSGTQRPDRLQPIGACTLQILLILECK